MNQIWTPAKLEKAWRVFDKAVGVIAEGIDVPEGELRSFLLDGRLPDTIDRPGPAGGQKPMTLQKRIAQYHEANPSKTCRDAAEALGASYDTVRGLGSREGIVWPKPKLSAVAAVVQAAPSGSKFRLQTVTGQYLHMGCESLTDDKSLAWKGTPAQLGVVRDRFPIAKAMVAVAVVQ